MRRQPKVVLASVAWLLISASEGFGLTDGELAEDFRKVVLGAEASSFGARAAVVRKFAGPVRVHVHSRSTIDRVAPTEAFIVSLPALILGLDLALVESPAQANFHVYVVDRKDYRRIVETEIYKRGLKRAPGRCITGIVAKSGRIQRSTSVLVSDEGDLVFRRCLVEEVLQGLGPINDDPTVRDSAFDDRSETDRFTEHDRLLLNALYDPRVEPGMRWRRLKGVLPAVIAEVRARLVSR